ncbi:unnamed protein product [Bursaphelenchus xylophilus]|uniref:(pine wood nematode) hypothetical protein n=1 Tax=Bursaphelenchus xylophilus TaxID=6326 RepID=A0A1I7RZA9_BURXY|nr:unnamed protein product [Bursaphelenchus xylophilus]CAG9106665.1 unnamed protein product [Bursaphelenchus xylophilus]
MSHEIDYVPRHEKPIVVILGFLNSLEKHYDSLKVFYEKFTPHVLVFVPKMFDALFWPIEDNRPFLEEMYKPLVEQYPDSPVIFHLFSQNGGKYFNRLWRKLNPQMRQQVKGFVFDSAPSLFPLNPMYYINARFFMWPKSEKTNGNFFFKAIPTELLNSLHYASAIGTWQFDQYINELRTLDLPHNQLYICSKDDRLIRYGDMEGFAADQMKRGKSVEIKAWAKGLHCDHFREKPAEYQDVCERFLQRVVGEDFVRNKAKI